MGLVHSECARIDPLETLSDARPFDGHANGIQEIASARTRRAVPRLGKIARTTARSNGLGSARPETAFLFDTTPSEAGNLFSSWRFSHPAISNLSLLPGRERKRH